jgi:hypothetical protein
MRLEQHNELRDYANRNIEVYSTSVRELLEKYHGNLKAVTYLDIAHSIEELFSNLSSIGGYTVLFTSDKGDALCAACAKRRYFIGKESVSCGTYDEGPAIQCDDCGEEIAASYSDPEATE